MTCRKALQKNLLKSDKLAGLHPRTRAVIKCLFSEHHLNRLAMEKFKTTLVGDYASRIAIRKEAEVNKKMHVWVDIIPRSHTTFL